MYFAYEHRRILIKVNENAAVDDVVVFGVYLYAK